MILSAYLSFLIRSWIIAIIIIVAVVNGDNSDKEVAKKGVNLKKIYENIEGDIQFKVSVENNELVLNILQGGELLKSYNIEQATKDLVNLANERGGYDNITVVIIKNI